jgi:hypothetical protein
MSTTLRIADADLVALVAELGAAGARVIAPVRAKGLGRDRVEYAPVESFADVVLDGPVPARSAKQYFLPATEPLFRWRQKKGDRDRRSLEPLRPDAAARHPAVRRGRERDPRPGDGLGLPRRALVRPTRVDDRAVARLPGR